MAENTFQYFSRLRVWWVIITTLYLLTSTSWYQQTAQSSVNKLLLILWHNRLPKQQYNLLKTTLILALSAYNSKANLLTTTNYYRIVISMIRCNFLQSLKNSAKGVQSHLKFLKKETQDKNDNGNLRSTPWWIYWAWNIILKLSNNSSS